MVSLHIVINVQFVWEQVAQQVINLAFVPAQEWHMFSQSIYATKSSCLIEASFVSGESHLEFEGE